MKIDIILWANDKDQTILASGISIVGCEAITKYLLPPCMEFLSTMEEAGLIEKIPTDEALPITIGCPVMMNPEDIISIIPQDVNIFFYNRHRETFLNMRGSKTSQTQSLQ